MEKAVQNKGPDTAQFHERNQGRPFDPQLRRTRTVILDRGEEKEKREEIRRYFHATFDIDEALMATLRYDEAFYRRADALRHPLIFYYGHTAVFFINKLMIARLIEKRIHPGFESMFAVGVDEMSWDDLDMAHYDWPTVEAVEHYRDEVRKTVDKIISSLPLTVPIQWDDPFWVILMGIEHARIHLETSSVLIRQLPLTLLREHPLWNDLAPNGPAPENSMIPVPSGVAVLGKDPNHPLYGWDNEYGRHEVTVESFKAAKYLVSNREYLQFVTDGGYRHDPWWTEEGLRWRTYRKAQHPLFWVPDGQSYRLRLTWHERDMPWNWPVEVNYLEAKAYCNWMKERTGRLVRLPTEAEWYLLRERFVQTDQPYWEQAPGNINLEHYASPCAVDCFSFGEFYDIVGNVWQWTETPIHAFRGFRIHPCYDDFSTPTFDGRHNLIKGGSWISTGNEATREARYAFRRHFFQHAGFRPVESEHEEKIKTDVYETDEMLCHYAEFHYGDGYFNIPNYPKACVQKALHYMEGRPRRKALDLGCSVGRATFELARHFDKVTGLDFSARFIQMGVKLKEDGFLQYTRVTEGELLDYVEKNLVEFGLAGVRDKVAFFQADACNLKQIYSGYDLVVALNLLDRLHHPRKFLEMIHERINRGGLLVLSSPYTWHRDHTDRNEWIGGFRKDGEPYKTCEALTDILQPNFRLLDTPQDIPFVIRETQRKYQHSIAQMTVWERL